MSTKVVTRAEVVAEARSWIGTPYLRGARVKGAGIDCGLFLVEVFLRCGLITEADVAEMHLEELRGDWWNHVSDQRYLLRMMRHARRILEGTCYRTLLALPGCLVATKILDTQRFNHGAVVTSWPRAVHAVREGVCEVDLSLDPMWSCRPIEIFDPFPEGAK